MRNNTVADRLIRAVTADGFVQVSAVDLTNTVERARNIHKTLPLATAALGRTLAAASMMGAALKGDDSSLTVQIKGDGPLGSVVAVSDNMGNVRGYLQNPAAELPLRASDGKLDVGHGIGAGQLTVIKDLGLKEPFSGCVELIGGEIAEDIAAYFYESEQIPTACALGVLVGREQNVEAAGGYIIQLMPGADTEIIEKIERGVMSAGNMTDMLSDGLTLRQIIDRVLCGFEVNVLSEQPVEYRCACSRDKVMRAFISMGRQELESMAAEQPNTEVTCQFCDQKYDFTAEQLTELVKSL